MNKYRIIITYEAFEEETVLSYSSYKEALRNVGHALIVYDTSIETVSIEYFRKDKFVRSIEFPIIDLPR